MKKFKMFISGLLVFALLIAFVPVDHVDAASKSVKLIKSLKDLKKVANILSGNYKLTKDLIIKSKYWTPIGTPEAPFTGTFDGNGYTINAVSTKSKNDYQGLFGCTKDAVIKNLKVSGTVRGRYYVGGIIGHMEGGRIVNCVSKTKVTGVDQVGGLVGRIAGGIALNCQNEGKVTGTGRCAGGITSDLYPSGTIYNCVNLATVKGSNLVGGISGGSTAGEIANCVNFGNVIGDYSVGAIAGDNNSYAGARYHNYFRQTDKINANYNSIGTGCYTFKTVNSKLSGEVTINNKTYNKLLNALNAGRNALRKETGEKLREWTGYDERPLLFK